MEAVDTSNGHSAEPSEVHLDDRTSQTAGIVELVKDDAERIVANWVIHVANTPAFRAWPTLGLAELQNAVPELVAAMLAAIRVAELDRMSEPLANAIEVATEHGRERGGAGFSIGALLAEFKALREELNAALRRVTGNDPAWHEAARELETRLNAVLDIALIEAAEGWVEGTRTRSADK